MNANIILVVLLIVGFNSTWLFILMHSGKGTGVPDDDC